MACGGVVCCAVPGIVVAGGDSLCTGGGVINGQEQRSGRVAARCVGAGVSWRASAGGVVRSVPSVFVAGGDSLGAGGGVVDSKEEGGGGVAACGVGAGVGR